MAITSSSRWMYLNKVLSRPGPFVDETFSPSNVEEALGRLKILVIGAGGLGCEILKNLALSGFKDIHVIDMDTIDISNLNRQFLFREDDVGKPKAEVAAAYVMKRVKSVKITPYYGAIQDKGEDYYMQFNIVVCGLDSVEARRWINSTLVEMVDMNNPDSLKPLIDGGTEGFKGQSRVILPTVTSCYECSLDMLTPPTAVPLCTLASIPRQPAHCIEWASILEWPRVMGDKKLDTDNPEHIQWLYEHALERAKEFNITGVTYSMTQGVVKNIIPAIASTNAIIAASCCNEALKIATTCNPYLNNYMMYTGNEAVYTYTFEHQRKPDCPVCGNLATTFEANGDWTLYEFIQRLKEKPDVQIKRPTLSTERKKLYYQAPPQLQEQTRPNLDKKLRDLITSGEEVGITDPGLPFSMRLNVVFD
ncbi:putative NEDD8 activating enzyme [Kalaharituber pfeilii]|nr:putative NEDD8 activating enzyme [Kalaharituber pfeilii]